MFALAGHGDRGERGGRCAGGGRRRGDLCERRGREAGEHAERDTGKQRLRHGRNGHEWCPAGVCWLHVDDGLYDNANSSHSDIIRRTPSDSRKDTCAQPICRHAARARCLHRFRVARARPAGTSDQQRRWQGPDAADGDHPRQRRCFGRGPRRPTPAARWRAAAAPASSAARTSWRRRSASRTTRRS